MLCGEHRLVSDYQLEAAMLSRIAVHLEHVPAHSTLVPAAQKYPMRQLLVGR